MALRAGYYGLKRKFIDKVNDWDRLVFPRSEQAYLGAVNVLDNHASGATKDGITFTVSDGIITANGTAASPAVQYATIAITNGIIPNKYVGMILSGCIDGSAETHNYNVQYFNAASGSPVTTTIMSKPAKIADYPYIRIFARVTPGAKVTDAIWKPMISFDGGEYVPRAMTNAELTAAITADEATLGDHKTTINAIISAATGAADFAAFKAAMEALTPLTRSLSTPDTRSIEPLETIPEETEIEEQPVKKTTRKKSTAKADTKEEV